MIGLQKRVDAFDVDAWEQHHGAHPGRPVPRDHIVSGAPYLHNPYAGVPYAWQLTETVDDFLKRLPPATTTSVPWVFICNPYIPRVNKRLSDTLQQKGPDNDNEAPDEEGSNVEIVVEGGEARLHLLRALIETAAQTKMAKSTKEKEMDKERKRAVNDILTLAHAAKVRAGKVCFRPIHEPPADLVPSKWMLFCSPRDVNEIWRIVAKATAKNELGIAAKVAPKPEGEDSRRDRLVCIYTTDFKDKADVGRVLQKLRELRLVESRGHPIYYKPGKSYTFMVVLTRADQRRCLHVHRNRVRQPMGHKSVIVQLVRRVLIYQRPSIESI